MTAIEEIRDRVRRVLPALRDDLAELVRIQSVSADPERHAEVRRSAATVLRLFSDEGFTGAVREVAGGLPAVVARRSGPPDAPTVLLYAHHDVQPENDPADWTTPPFLATERDGRLFGRGTADDKAGIIAHLGAVRAWGADLPVSVVLLIEGEEEVGSRSLAPLLRRDADELRSDAVIVLDSANWDLGTPALTTTLRGLVEVDVEVRTLTHAVHSGMWGGLVPDAVTALSRLIATLHDDRGNVAVDGLHAGPATPVNYPEARLRAESGAVDTLRWIGDGPAVERLWTKPALSVTGLDAPRVDAASNTLVPTARARLSLRIAPGDSPANALTALRTHLHTHVPWGADLSVTQCDTAPALTLGTTGPAHDAARAALTEAWDGIPPVEMGIGGSVLAAEELTRAFPEAAVVVTGVQDPDSRAHGTDESLHLGEFERAVLAEAVLLHHLAEALRRGADHRTGRKTR